MQATPAGQLPPPPARTSLRRLLLQDNLQDPSSDVRPLLQDLSSDPAGLRRLLSSTSPAGPPSRLLRQLRRRLLQDPAPTSAASCRTSAPTSASSCRTSAPTCPPPATSAPTSPPPAGPQLRRPPPPAGSAPTSAASCRTSSEPPADLSSDLSASAALLQDLSSDVRLLLQDLSSDAPVRLLQDLSSDVRRLLQDLSSDVRLLLQDLSSDVRLLLQDLSPDSASSCRTSAPTSAASCRTQLRRPPPPAGPQLRRPVRPPAGPQLRRPPPPAGPQLRRPPPPAGPQLRRPALLQDLSSDVRLLLQDLSSDVRLLLQDLSSDVRLLLQDLSSDVRLLLQTSAPTPPAGPQLRRDLATSASSCRTCRTSAPTSAASCRTSARPGPQLDLNDRLAPTAGTSAPAGQLRPPQRAGPQLRRRRSQQSVNKAINPPPTPQDPHPTPLTHPTPPTPTLLPTPPLLPNPPQPPSLMPLLSIGAAPSYSLGGCGLPLLGGCTSFSRGLRPPRPRAAASSPSGLGLLSLGGAASTLLGLRPPPECGPLFLGGCAPLPGAPQPSSSLGAVASPSRITTTSRGAPSARGLQPASPSGAALTLLGAYDHFQSATSSLPGGCASSLGAAPPHPSGLRLHLPRELRPPHPRGLRLTLLEVTTNLQRCEPPLPGAAASSARASGLLSLGGCRSLLAGWALTLLGDSTTSRVAACLSLGAAASNPSGARPPLLGALRPSPSGCGLLFPRDCGSPPRGSPPPESTSSSLGAALLFPRGLRLTSSELRPPSQSATSSPIGAAALSPSGCGLLSLGAVSPHPPRRYDHLQTVDLLSLGAAASSPAGLRSPPRRLRPPPEVRPSCSWGRLRLLDLVGCAPLTSGACGLLSLGGCASPSSEPTTTSRLHLSPSGASAPSRGLQLPPRGAASSP
ncbi:hypothetical protein C7M84_004747 [Penaeus vannamei]|uniref:Uncharacterized protein n=1 Tax=Penaeus vannamei TaxID=6689 RepID=A0A423TJU4_PENVA|nr:hypothetical protein C7M84_004747 [Penaeus vannamei]